MDQTDNIILSTAYFPPVSYFAQIVNHKRVFIESCENYLKQSYRNRCLIYSSNGKLPLIVPVELGSFHKTAIRDLKIDNSRKWQTNHTRSLKAAYSSSAFYEFFMDELATFFSGKFDFLFDYNFRIISELIRIIGVDTKLQVTESFNHEYDFADDLRYIIHPKKRKIIAPDDQPAYFQVFGIEKGFLPDLSILDLLFNMGSETYGYLKSN